jgi:hypothetical protein
MSPFVFWFALLQRARKLCVPRNTPDVSDDQLMQPVYLLALDCAILLSTMMEIGREPSNPLVLPSFFPLDSNLIAEL